ncbi:MAG: hypothetical protein V5A62_01940 [Haloarculaceae archaeon]
MLDGTTYGLLGALVLLHLLTLAYAYRRRTEGGGGADAAVEGGPTPPARPVPGEFDADTETIACEICDTENAAEYAFCRACVSELPTRTPTVDGGAGTFRSGSA